MNELGERIIKWLLTQDTAPSRRQTIMQPGVEMVPAPRSFMLEWGPAEIVYQDEAGNEHTWIFEARHAYPIRIRKLIRVGQTPDGTTRVMALW